MSIRSGGNTLSSYRTASLKPKPGLSGPPVLKSASRQKLNTLLREMLAHATGQKIPRTQVVVDVDALWLM